MQFCVIIDISLFYKYKSNKSGQSDLDGGAQVCSVLGHSFTV